MAYICQNCGVTNEDASSICNPIDEQYNKKSCAVGTAGVCEYKVEEMKYTCECGNVSANPQHLCKPHKMEHWDR